MGYGSYSAHVDSVLSSSRKTKSASAIFTSSKMSADMNPKNLVIRESRDSVEHPNSVGVMVFTDVTGSMGTTAEMFVRGKLGTIMNTVIEHGTLHPQLLFGAIGDHECDSAPLQVGQFESSNDLLDKWITNIWVEGRGGGNEGESYCLPWLVAGRHSSMDCFEKRGEKGFIFTMGDEPPLLKYPASALQKIFGYAEARDLTASEMLMEAKRMFHVYHITIKEGTNNGDSAETRNGWGRLLGNNALFIDNIDQVAELIATTVAVVRGAELNEVIASFDARTAGAVSTALAHVTSSITKQPKAGIVKL